MAIFDKILNSAASGMSAESIRLNTIASNLANANSVGTSEETTYRAKHPVFTEIKDKVMGLSDIDQPTGGVRVTDIKTSHRPLEKKYDPDNPNSNDEGYIFVSDVNPIEEMTNMIDASRNYQADSEIMTTIKKLVLQTFNVLNSK